MAGEKVKTYSGQKHVQNLTPEELADRAASKALYEQGADGVVSIDVWFMLRGHGRNPTMQAAMRAFTTVRKATPEAFDQIFASF